MSKATGQEINIFYNEFFPNDCYLDYDKLSDSCWDNKDRLSLEDQKEYDLRILGKIIRHDESESWTFEELFTKWKTDKKVDTIQITLPKRFTKELVEYILAILSDRSITATTKIL